MPEYHLNLGQPRWRWNDADELQRGFIECLFFQAPDDSDGPDGDIQGEGQVCDLAPEAWQSVRAICAAFRSAAGEALAEAAELEDYSEEQAGRDLCYTLLGAGVGFTDRPPLEGRDDWEALGAPRVGDPAWPAWEAAREASLAYQLDRAARQSGHCEGLYRGDDGNLYLWAEGVPTIETEGA